MTVVSPFPEGFIFTKLRENITLSNMSESTVCKASSLASWVLHADAYACEPCSVLLNTVNWEIFARILFSRNFAYAEYRENKILAKCRNHSVVYWSR